MFLKVKAADLKWRGERLLQGASFEATTDRELKQADVLKRVGQAEEVAARRPRRAPRAKLTPPELSVAAPPVAPSAVEPMSTRSNTYNTRRLKVGD